MARPRAWGDTMFNVDFPVTATQSTTNLLSTLSVLDTVTAVRLVIHMQMVLGTPVETVDGVSILDLGIGVAASEAFNAGALPDPDQGGEQPARGWLWRDRLTLTHVDQNSLIWSQELRADIRTMRKVDRGVLYLIMRSTLSAGVYVPFRGVGIIRALCLT